MISRRNLGRDVQRAVAAPGYASRVLLQRLKAVAAYQRGTGRSPYPETISLFLTFRCNLRCFMCAQWGEQGAFLGLGAEQLRSELSLEELRRVVDEVAGFRPSITLFGGEPLASRHWAAVLAAIKARGLYCNMVTNGTLMKAHAAEAVQARMDEIIFSLEGPEAIHDEVVQVKGAFARATEGFQALQALKAQHHARVPLVNISCVLTDKNYLTIEEVPRIAREIGAHSVTFHHMLFLGRANYEAHNRYFKDTFGTESTDFGGFVRDELPKIDVERLLALMGRVRQQRNGVQVSFHPNLPEEDVRSWYTVFDYVPKSYWKGCLSPWAQAYIFPDGSVRPCEELNMIFGNVRKQPFKAIWNNEDALRFRRTVRAGTFRVCAKCTEYYRI